MCSNRKGREREGEKRAKVAFKVCKINSVKIFDHVNAMFIVEMYLAERASFQILHWNDLKNTK